MSKSRRWTNLLPAATLAALALLGCGEDPPATSSNPIGGEGGAGSSALPVVPCPQDTPAFGAGPDGIGLEAVGAKQTVSARIIAAKPLSPERYENDWSVALLDAQGAPLPDAEITSACAFMRVHGHYELARSVTRLSDPSTFELKALNLSMRGPWEVELTVTSPSLTGTADAYTECDRRNRAPGADKIVFHTCIRERD
jgi:hypothetical protein